MAKVHIRQRPRTGFMTSSALSSSDPAPVVPPAEVASDPPPNATSKRKEAKPKKPNPYADNDYAVGKGKTPVHTRYKPKQSGNPRGRPPGSKNVSTIVSEVLNKKHEVKEGGKIRRMTTTEIIIHRLIKKATEGDFRSIQFVLGAMAPPPDETNTAAQRQEEELYTVERDIWEHMSAILNGGEK